MSIVSVDIPEIVVFTRLVSMSTRTPRIHGHSPISQICKRGRIEISALQTTRQSALDSVSATILSAQEKT